MNFEFEFFEFMLKYINVQTAKPALCAQLQ